MACSKGDTYYLEAEGTTKQTASDSMINTINVCTATKILDRLHREFTEKYVATATTGKTLISDDSRNNPTFYLRAQPPLAQFPAVSGSGTESAGGTSTNRLYNILMASKTADDQIYRSAIHAITYGVYNAGISKTDYLNPPNSYVVPTDFATPVIFKGLYGLNALNAILENMISKNISNINLGDFRTINNNISKYIRDQTTKTTLEEIARRENEIYREKFLHIILVILGIFLVSSQLVKKYFSLGSSGGSSGGFGFGSGNLFTGFGLGTGSGLFSRFGGLGLGRSGRSRLTSMFSNNPYSLSNR